MEEIPVLQAVFNPEMWEQVKGYQGELIRLFKDFTNKLLVLHGQREADAIPVMIIIVEFMEKWLHSDHFVEIFKELPDISSFLVEGFFPELSGMIYKAGMFPTPAVLSYTAKYLELHLLLSIRAFHSGFLGSIKAIEAILSPDKSYYISNNAKCDPHVNPFGDGLGVDADYEDFVNGLNAGDHIDAVKACQGDTKMIWSRAVVTDVKQSNLYISFLGENQTSTKEKLLKKAPFMINKFKTRSLDYEWRQGLSEGDLFDLYLGKNGWLLFQIEERIQQYDNKDVYTFVKAKQVVGTGPSSPTKSDSVVPEPEKEEAISKISLTSHYNQCPRSIIKKT